MESLLFIFGSAFVVGFSGAMMPGPVLTATISEVLKKGWFAGPLIVLGHAILEIVVLVLVVAGLGKIFELDIVMAVLGWVGGSLLFVMGLQMAGTAKKAAAEIADVKANPKMAIRGPVVTGILTSVSNPYFPLWWATIGLNYVGYALKHGMPGLVSFYSGHILSDLTWYTIVALAVHSGRRICPPPVYRWLLTLCGAALCVLGIIFIRAGFKGI